MEQSLQNSSEGIKLCSPLLQMEVVVGCPSKWCVLNSVLLTKI